MASERLSKQQKWILKYLYDRDMKQASEIKEVPSDALPMHTLESLRSLCMKSYYPYSEVFEAFKASDVCKWWDGFSSDPRQVSFSRCIANMEDKCLIDVDRRRYTTKLPVGFPEVTHRKAEILIEPGRGAARHIQLSDEGLEIAKNHSPLVRLSRRRDIWKRAGKATR